MDIALTNEIKPIPSSPQERFCRSNVRELGFGGQAGGGKSMALILDALYQLDKPGYNAIMFRRTYKRLKEADGLIDLTSAVYPIIGGVYRQSDYTWVFPRFHDNTIRLSHMEHEKNAQDYSGSQYAWIGFDELEEFVERQYLFLFSRNRSSNPSVNLYMRSTFNPGGVGHFWIKKRFINTDIANKAKWFCRVGGIDTEASPKNRNAIERMFIPSRLEDNPYLWQDGNSEYDRGLNQLDIVDYRRLRLGDWDVRRTGRVYHSFDDKNVGPASYELDLSKAEGYYHAHDFGAVNRIWGLWAKIGKSYYLIHEEQLPEGTTENRAKKIKSHFQGRKVVAGWGGAKSEKQQRIDYAKFGVAIRLPSVQDVESQIDEANKMFDNEEMIICSDMTMTIDHLENCVRDEKEGIQDKSQWHFADMIRYFAAGLKTQGWAR